MRLGMVHLSDIHLKGDSNSLVDSFDRLLHSAFSRARDCEKLLVLVTGDLAFSGQRKEYAVAAELLEKIRTKGQVEGVRVEMVICPGNHDCDFTGDSDIRDMLIDGVEADPNKLASKPIQDQLLQVQANFFEFMSEQGLAESSEPKICFSRSIAVGEHSVQVNVLNSAFMSNLNERQGGLFFPVDAIEELDLNEQSLQVFLLHHPFNWFESDNSLAVRKALAERADIILTGHEHTYHVSTIRSHTLQTSYEYFEGSVLQDNSDQTRSEYQFIKIDLEARQLCHEILTFEDGTYSSQLEEEAWREYSTNRTSQDADLQPQFKRWLNDVGANFSHPRKTSNLDFYDLFVAPDLREIQEGEKRTVQLERPIGDEKFQEILRDGTGVVISASEQAGKTHLAKHLIQQLLSIGYLPVYLDCTEVSRVRNENEAERLLLKAIRSQFSGNGRERFLATEVSRRIVFLDDFHRLEISGSDKVELLKFASENFHSFVVLVDEILQLEGLVSGGQSVEALVNLSWFRLLELGHFKREQLIENWLLLGRDTSIPDGEFDRELHLKKTLLDQMIGSKLLPPTPINLLIILQQIEIFSDNPTAASGSSSGYLYELLITFSLRRNLRQLSINGAHTYLTELAEAVWSSGTSKFGRLSTNDFDDFHKRYEELHDLSVRKERLLDSLCKCELLTRTEDGYVGFKYKYSYYFFAARAVAESQSLESNLERLLETIHSEASTNILIFLTYHSSDSKVIDALIRAADSLFSDCSRCDLSAHHKVAQDLVMGSTKFSLPATSARTNRKEVARAVDERDQSQISEEEQEPAADQEVQNLNAAFKTVQILGQVLRNVAESATRSEKDRILESCVSLGLRTLEFIIQALERSSDEFVDLVAKSILRDEDIAMSEKRERAKVMVSRMLESVCTGTIKKISNSIGTQKLERTYKRAFQSDTSTCTDKLIDLAVKLDHFRDFPSPELESLSRAVSDDDLLTATVLRRLVRTHFYLREERQAIRDRYCKVLGISVPEPVKNPYLIAKKGKSQK